MDNDIARRIMMRLAGLFISKAGAGKGFFNGVCFEHFEQPGLKNRLKTGGYGFYLERKNTKKGPAMQPLNVPHPPCRPPSPPAHPSVCRKPKAHYPVQRGEIHVASGKDKHGPLVFEHLRIF